MLILFLKPFLLLHVGFNFASTRFQGAHDDEAGPSNIHIDESENG